MGNPAVRKEVPQKVPINERHIAACIDAEFRSHVLRSQPSLYDCVVPRPEAEGWGGVMCSRGLDDCVLLLGHLRQWLWRLCRVVMFEAIVEVFVKFVVRWEGCVVSSADIVRIGG